MCGINGFNFSDENLIRKMNEMIAYRGPDDTGIFVGDGISLGHNRLSIIDLSPAGHQPMLSQDGNLVIVFNGELYNFKEIRTELQKLGRKFVSNSDTEVVLQSYEEYGADCLKKFNGIFAFAIWDSRIGELFLVRDHFGVKPLFYCFENGRFIFSSEIKTLFCHNIKKELNYLALNLYFRFLYVNGPETIWKNIYKLSPGHYLIMRGGHMEIKKYWEVKEVGGLACKESIKEEIRRTMSEAVKRQMIADVPVGLFLSGGIDSTVILSLMSEFSGAKVKTYSIGFDYPQEVEKFNQDRILARQTAKMYGADHHEYVVSAKDMVDNLEKVVWHVDDLVANPTQVLIYLLSAIAKKDVSVVLGGDGGDELFGGYDRYYYYYLIQKWRGIPKLIRQNKLMAGLFGVCGKNKIYEKINLNSGLDLFWSMMAQKEDTVAQFLRPNVSDLHGCVDYIKKMHFNNQMKNDLAREMMRVDIFTWLTDESLAMTDKLTMAFALEERVPILDKEVVELAMRIPTKFKMDSAKQGKLIFREAFKDKIPAAVYNKNKTGWFTPVAKWLRTDMRDMAYEILSEGYNQETREMFDYVAIRKILDCHISGEQYALNTIWSLINFQIWFRTFK